VFSELNVEKVRVMSGSDDDRDDDFGAPPPPPEDRLPMHGEWGSERRPATGLTTRRFPGSRVGVCVDPSLTGSLPGSELSLNYTKLTRGRNPPPPRVCLLFCPPNCLLVLPQRGECVRRSGATGVFPGPSG